jgi:MinD superfamily P-loop ATPase
LSKVLQTVASGKGGTGKTTVATNLASVAVWKGRRVCYADCDVEEPNGHLFMDPVIDTRREVQVPVPRVDEDACTGCGLCAKICQYSAIICLKDTALTFAELCHGCGGCVLVCPENAITESTRSVGLVETGRSRNIRFVHGRLRVGEAMSPPLMRAVKEELSDSELTFVDVPPGTSCPAITAVSGSDYAVLVTEPTPFGLHDLELALEMVKELGLPHGVVVNRHRDGNSAARDFCDGHSVPILAEIPEDRAVAQAYSRGKLAVAAVPGYDRLFLDLWENIRGAAS